MTQNPLAARAVHTVLLQPAGIEMEVEEGETVLDAAFRQGISLMHGCKEGQCSSCKCVLVEGDVELLKYSTFALSEMDRDTNHILLCRTLAYSDIEVELLNYDEDLLSRSIAVKDFAARLTAIVPLTHDIFRLEMEIEQPLKFWAGQYVDITVPGKGITRSFSMANPPSEPNRLHFIIKKYGQGAFSSLLDGGLKAGDSLMLRGPFGTCLRRENRTGPLVLVGGGSGMSPLWSILQDQIGCGEPDRPIRFFYGARQVRDLFYLDRFAELAKKLPDFRFIPALSDAAPEDNWTGETGFIHEVVRAHLPDMGDAEEIDVYSCGPPPMIDALLPVLQIAGVEADRIYFDKFTPALR
jgi:propane monooxygenase reductase component